MNFERFRFIIIFIENVIFYNIKNLNFKRFKFMIIFVENVIFYNIFIL
jgi:hypothetical protein